MQGLVETGGRYVRTFFRFDSRYRAGYGPLLSDPVGYHDHIVNGVGLALEPDIPHGVFRGNSEGTVRIAETGSRKHGPRIDGNREFPVNVGNDGIQLIRADGIGAAEMFAAILQVMPLDEYVDTPVVLIEKEALDKDLPTPIWDTFASIVSQHDPRGAKALGRIPRNDFYEQARSAYCVVQTTESALYGCAMIRKGVIRP